MTHETVKHPDRTLSPGSISTRFYSEDDMVVPKEVKHEEEMGAMDTLVQEKREVMKTYQIKATFPVEVRNEKIREFNAKWIAAGGLEATTLCEVK